MKDQHLPSKSDNTCWFLHSVVSGYKSENHVLVLITFGGFYFMAFFNVETSKPLKYRYCRLPGYGYDCILYSFIYSSLLLTRELTPYSVCAQQTTVYRTQTSTRSTRTKQIEVIIQHDCILAPRHSSKNFKNIEKVIKNRSYSFLTWLYSLEFATDTFGVSHCQYVSPTILIQFFPPSQPRIYVWVA